MALISKVLSAVVHKIKHLSQLVMFSHTLFSLPFALIAMLLAGQGMPPIDVVFWILVCLVAGRNGANALNRYVDRRYDALNPRTADRHLPRGIVQSWEVLLLTGICYLVFIYGAYRLNPLCLMLSPVALFLFTTYSFTKRFTWLCHIVLGITCAGAPVGAWLAVTGTFAFPPLVLGAVVVLWVGGFDIIYGTQDIDFDRSNGLYSIPAQFGLKNALWIARGMHLLMVLLLVLLGYLSQLGFIYGLGVAISGVLLLIEHGIIDPKHRLKMNFAAYHINQIISVLLLSFFVVDLILK